MQMATDPNPKASAWQPPPNYHPLESKVAGITIFAPTATEPTTEEATTTYKCPQCGAATRFNVAAGGVACEHCGYRVASQAQTVGKQADEFEFTLDTLDEAGQGWGVARQELHCTSCGADIALPEDELSVTCPFCASNSVYVRQEISQNLRPRFLIPFKVLPAHTKNLAQEWMGKGWFHPDQLATSALIHQFKGIYLPFWTFDANVRAAWTAEVGYERQENYYDHGSKSWRTRTVIDWRWEKGEARLPVDDLLVSGSTHTSRLILERLKPFQLNDLVTYNPDFLAGWQAQSYEVTLPDAWEQGKQVIREMAMSACKDQIHSHHVRNFSMSADFSDETWRYILLPVYLAVYRFEDKTYQVMINGQTGKVAGQKPVAWWKVWLVVAALLAPGMLLGLIGFPLLLAGGIGLVPIILGFILLAVGGIISFGIYQKAVASEES